MRLVFAAAVALVGLGCIVHCSAAGGESASPGPDLFGDASTIDAMSASDSGNRTFPGALDSSRGLILVHGSPNLPAFRLCFGTLSGSGSLITSASSALRPLPDRDLMPDSNVVGVEIGSAVRLKPLGDVGVQASEHVFAIPEVYVRPGSGPDLPCSARICPTAFSSTCLQRNPPVPGERGYYDLGALPSGAIDSSVQLLAVNGCVPNAADAGVAACGADYNPATGNMKLTVLPLDAYKTVTPTQFFVQVAQLSPPVAGTSLTVTYGALADPKGAQPVAVSPNFGELAPPTFPEIFALDRAAPSIYASQGFQLTVGSKVFTKSLAEIQLVTAPQAVPDDLYSSKSNFVLVLLGDPSLSDAQGHALSELTEPGLLLHLLVVPVGQPVAQDAGSADAGGE